MYISLSLSLPASLSLSLSFSIFPLISICFQVFAYISIWYFHVFPYVFIFYMFHTCPIRNESSGISQAPRPSQSLGPASATALGGLVLPKMDTPWQVSNFLWKIFHENGKYHINYKWKLPNIAMENHHINYKWRFSIAIYKFTVVNGGFLKWGYP